MTAYFLSSVLWTLAGLAVGYSIGSAGNQPQRVAPRENRVARSRTDVVVGVLLLILAVISVSTMSVSLTSQERVVECQARFNEAFSNALRERVDAANQERAAQRQMLSAVLDPNGTRETRLAALESYDKSLAEADTNRSENPLPDRPRCE